MSALVETLVFAMQQVADTAARTLPDTIITKQVAAERTWWDTVTSIASGIMTLSLMILTIALVPAAWNFRKSYKKISDLLDRVYADVFPLVSHASTIADNVNYITTSVRTDIQQVNRTITDANRRLHEAVVLAEQRLAEFEALLEVVQREAEGAFVSTAATVRGVRAGAATLRDEVARDARAGIPEAQLTDGETLIYGDDDDDGRGTDDDYPPRAAHGPRVRPRRGAI